MPILLYSYPNCSIKSELDLFLDLGASRSEVAEFIASNPNYLRSRFKDNLISSLDFLKSYIGNNAAIMTIFKRWPMIIKYYLNWVVPNRILIFRDHGVPDCIVMKLLISSPKTIVLKADRFKEITEMLVSKIGIDPSSPRLLLAFRAMAGMSKSTWEKKLTVFQDELGWSEDDVLSKFTKKPKLFTLSLEKRIIPRCAVLKILKSVGIISEKSNVCTILKMPKNEFVEKYVTKYQEEVPGLMEAYKGGK